MKIPNECKCGGQLFLRGDIEISGNDMNTKAEEIIVCEDCGRVYRAYYLLTKVVVMEEKDI